MHDVGTFVWVVLVVIGVVSSIVSNGRKRAATSAPPGSAPPRPVPPYVVLPQAMPPQRMPPGSPPPLSAPPPAAGAPAAAAAAPAAPPARTVRVRPPAPAAPRAPATDHTLDVFRAPRRPGPRVFEGRGALVRAVIGAEILGKPVALRDE